MGSTRPAGSGAAGRGREAFGLRHDPTRQLTQAEVENEILRLSARLERQTDELAGLGRLAAEAESNHKALRAQAFLKAEGTDARRGATAELVTQDSYLRRKISESLYESAKQACRSTEHQLDALRTIAANIRAQT